MKQSWIEEATEYLGPDVILNQESVALLDALENSEVGDNIVSINQIQGQPTVGNTGNYSSVSAGCALISGCPVCC